MPRAVDAAAPPRRQRVAAYAVVRRTDRDRDDLLLVHLAPRIQPDLWTLPGGGIDHGEDPRDAVRREVHEETGLVVEPGRLLDVLSRHFTGARPDGVVEDFHGIGLIFAAEVAAGSLGTEPRVVEVDGTTAAVAWQPRAEWDRLPLSPTAQHAVRLLDAEGART